MSQSVIDAIVRLSKKTEVNGTKYEFYRFYSQLLLQMNRFYTTKIPTAGVSVTEKINLYINPNFFNNLTNDCQEEVLIHECEHILRDHIQRSKEYATKDGDFTTHSRFNIAGDLCINESLPTIGSQYPVKMRDGTEFSGCSVEKMREFIPDLESNREAEYYYFKLKKGEDEIKKRLGLDGLSDEEIQKKLKELFSTTDDHSTWEESRDIPGVLLDNVLRGALNKASKGAGNCPEHVKSLLDKLNNSTVNWKQQLNRFKSHIDRFVKEKTRKKRNRRYGILYPGKVKRPKLKLVIGVDTSGSVSEKALEQFFSEIDKIYTHVAEIYVIQCDAEIQSVEKYVPKKEINISGRGGTLYQPVLDKAAELEADGLIYFGDGDCYENDLQKPKMPVLWAMLEGCKPPVTWGMTCEVKEI